MANIPLCFIWFCLSPIERWALAFKVIVVNTSAVLKAISSTVEPLVAVQDVAIWNMTVPRVSSEKNINPGIDRPGPIRRQRKANWAESASAKLRVPSWIFVPVPAALR